MSGYSFEFLSKCVIWRNLLHYLPAVLVVCLLAPSVTAQETHVISAKIDEMRETTCGLARDNRWADLVGFIGTQDIELEIVLEQTVCVMAETTAKPYYGNIWELSARYSGFVADVIKFSTRYLLKDRNEHDIFVSLVRGTNTRVYWPRDKFSSHHSVDGNGGAFYELNISWENIPNKRRDVEIAARAICLSIDRFNVQGLDDIRANECMTPPFVFPPRE